MNKKQGSLTTNEIIKNIEIGRKTDGIGYTKKKKGRRRRRLPSDACS